jgi:hypothetical protein
MAQYARADRPPAEILEAIHLPVEGIRADLDAAVVPQGKDGTGTEVYKAGAGSQRAV